MNNINIYLIRHPESEANANTKHLIGQDWDTPLTELGIEQTNKLALRFKDTKFDFIFSSFFKRAKVAADIFAQTVNQNVCTRIALVEYDPGDWKGKVRSDVLLSERNQILHQHMGFLFPNGESYHQVERRIATFLESDIIYNKTILEMANEKEINIAVFSHGQTLKCALHHIMGFDQSFLSKIRLNNTGICKVIYNEKGFHLETINDTSHLK